MQEPEEISDSGESSFSRFGSVLQAALQGIGWEWIRIFILFNSIFIIIVVNACSEAKQ